MAEELFGEYLLCDRPGPTGGRHFWHHEGTESQGTESRALLPGESLVQIPAEPGVVNIEASICCPT
eukprot:11429570-Karenia_brevis.AAC.1